MERATPSQAGELQPRAGRGDYLKTDKPRYSRSTSQMRNGAHRGYGTGYSRSQTTRKQDSDLDGLGLRQTVPAEVHEEIEAKGKPRGDGGEADTLNG